MIRTERCLGGKPRQLLVFWGDSSVHCEGMLPQLVQAYHIIGREVSPEKGKIQIHVQQGVTISAVVTEARVRSTLVKTTGQSGPQDWGLRIRPPYSSNRATIIRFRLLKGSFPSGV